MMKALVLCGWMLGELAFAQTEARVTMKVVTVCEILAHTDQYRDSVVAVVGRLYTSSSLIDSTDFLTQDRCEKPVVTKGFRWPSKILIWPDSEDGFPKAPTDVPKMDPELVAKQLGLVRQTTKLGVHKEPRLNQKGTGPSSVDVPNEWALVYGRIFGSSNLTKESCDEPGCRGVRGAPIAIFVEPKNIYIVNEDGTVRDVSERRLDEL